ncbi:hypothetical protein [Burkholderia cepacia]|uniref:hypothetical protein n=1 Tax=Burkholderia cepacia TaxID=292 RepID=UPI00299041F8|nr:hypothetical protein [Burkholderia cepacia]
MTVAQAGLTPNIYTKRELKFDPTDQKYNNDILEVINSGGAIHNTAINVATFIRVRIYDDGKSRFVYVPVNGYYFSQFSTGEPTGVLATFTGYDNNKKFSNLFRSSIGKGDGSSGVEIDLVRVVKVKYIDHLDRKNTIYFINSELTDGPDAEAMLKTSHIMPMLDIDTASLQDIVSKAKNDKRLYQRD